MSYMYDLTFAGLEEKVRVTYRFLKHKLQEYEDIKTEIERLKSETKVLYEMREELRRQGKMVFKSEP